MISALGEALRALGAGLLQDSPPRSGFQRGGALRGVIETMPHREPGGGVTIKTVSYSPDNVARHRLPTIMGTIARVEDKTGRLLALADAGLLTALRTGAASAIATRLLAHPDAHVVGIVGAGAQAVTQLHGITQVLDVREVLVHDINLGTAADFARRVAFLNLDVKMAEPREVLARAEVICTATSVKPGEGPVLPDGVHQPHLHVNSVGADETGKTELPVPLLRRALVCVDHREQALKEGECQQLSEHEVGPSLAELCAHPSRALKHRGRLTVFDSTGFAFEDHVAFDVLMGLADELGVGTKLALEGQPEDLLDPYSIAAFRRTSGDGPRSADASSSV
ncbi:ornithine cyclodeaminase family protein [Lentzea jiangxiensis]|nr:hypothetical protein [Lentzea jiangxiensis]